MRNKHLDDRTRADIDGQVSKILRGLGNPEPPLSLDEVRELLKLDRQYYSSTDDSALREFVSKAKIATLQVFKRPTLILDVVKKWDLKALYLPDRKRILIDRAQPEKKWRWSEAHETIHSVIPWHDALMHGDNKYTLSPECHEHVEAETNYGAGRLLFIQDRFDAAILDSAPNLKLVGALAKDFKNTITSTLWRAVEALGIPALGVISQHPHYTDDTFKPSDPCRYFITSRLFEAQFSGISEHDVFEMMKTHCSYSRRGPLATEQVILTDDRGDEHVFAFESFHYQYETLTLLTYISRRAVAIAIG